MGRPPDRSSFSSSSIPGAEIVIGIVAPVGTDVEFVDKTIADRLKHFGYRHQPIRVSRLIEEFGGLETQLREEPVYERTVSYMDAGNELRKNSERGDILALSAVGKIRQERKSQSKDESVPSPCTAYVVRSLKHPDEVRTLREIYGRGFFLLGVAASSDARLKVLTEHKGVPEDKARELLKRDESELEGHGQQTRDAFHLADAFCAVGSDEDRNYKQIWRLLDLLFGQPFITPMKEEYAMFLAYAASVRSADLSRQVGAVIVSREGDVLATGANDVPAPLGGTYWSEGYVDWPKTQAQSDPRDWVLGFDSNRKRRDEIAEEVAEKMRGAERERVLALLKTHLEPLGYSEVAADLAREVDKPVQEADALAILAQTKLMDLTEFGRAVHAEMDALMACTRVGAKAKGALLFCTTFPCHNCTKHIIAAGIHEVVYIEPYPKSLAQQLYPEAVSTPDVSSASFVSTDTQQEPSQKKVTFRPFTGVGPRRYLDLFSLSLSTGRTLDRKAAVPNHWSRADSTLRVSMVPTSYLEREEAAFGLLNVTTKETDQ